MWPALCVNALSTGVDQDQLMKCGCADQVRLFFHALPDILPNCGAVKVPKSTEAGRRDRLHGVSSGSKELYWYN